MPIHLSTMHGEEGCVTNKETRATALVKLKFRAQLVICGGRVPAERFKLNVVALVTVILSLDPPYR